MKSFTSRRILSVTIAVLAAAFCATAFFIQRKFYEKQKLGDPELAALQSDKSKLTSFSDAAVETVASKARDLRKKLWSPATFDRWSAATLPKLWTIQELGIGSQRQLIGRRYAFQRPNASDSDWTEIVTFLGNLERAPCVTVQSVNLAVEPGYSGSRHFTQCLFVAVFYYPGAEDLRPSAQGARPPATPAPASP